MPTDRQPKPLSDACGPECEELLARRNGEQRHDFAIEYAVDCDRKRAYEAAGYTGENRQSRHEVLTNSYVQAAIRRHRMPSVQAAADRVAEYREMVWRGMKANTFDLWTYQEPTSKAHLHLKQIMTKGVEDRDYVPPSADVISKNEEAIEAAIDLLEQDDVLGAMAVLDEVVETLGSKGWRPASKKELQRAIDAAACIRPKRPDEIPLEIQMCVSRVSIDQSRGKISYSIDKSKFADLWAKITGQIQQRITVEQAEAVGLKPLERLREVLPGLLEAVEEDRRAVEVALEEGTGELMEIAGQRLVLPETGAVLAWVRGMAQRALEDARKRGDDQRAAKWEEVLAMEEVGAREIMMGLVWGCRA